MVLTDNICQLKLNIMGLFDAIASVAGSAVNAAGTAAQIKSQETQQSKAQLYNLMMYQMQKKDELEMWRMNNLYNSPSAQVQRLLAAGINPASTFGDGTVGNSSSAPSAPSAPTYPLMSQDFIGDTFRSTAQMIQQSALLASQIDLNKAKADETRSHKEKLEAETKQIYDTLEPTIAKLISEANLNDEQTLKLAQDIQNSVKMVNAQISDIESEIALRKKQGEKIDSDILLNDARIDELVTSIQYTCEQMRGLKSNNDVQILYNTFIKPYQKAFANFDLETKSENNFQAYLQSRTMAKTLDILEKYGDKQAVAELKSLFANTDYTRHKDANIITENWLEFFKIVSIALAGSKLSFGRANKIGY